jgi:DNA recombination protein RmuC
MTWVVVAAVLAGIAGFGVAWLLRGSRAATAAATAGARLESLKTQLTREASDYAALKSQHGEALEQYREESNLRASAAAVAERVPDLEIALSKQNREIIELREQIPELNTRITEERKAAVGQMKIVNDAETALSDAFKALSADALRKNHQIGLGETPRVLRHVA